MTRSEKRVQDGTGETEREGGERRRRRVIFFIYKDLCGFYVSRGFLGTDRVSRPRKTDEGHRRKNG